MSKAITRAKRAKKAARKPATNKQAIDKARRSMMWAAWRVQVHTHSRWSRI